MQARQHFPRVLCQRHPPLTAALDDHDGLTGEIQNGAVNLSVEADHKHHPIYAALPITSAAVMTPHQ